MAPGAARGVTVRERAICPRCGAYLRAVNAPGPDNPHGLCDPCLRLVASCLPFAPSRCRETAPPDVNLVELVAGLMLTHDALRPGEPLYLREALADYGVEADHVKVWQTVGKLRRRHGLVINGRSREPGYAVSMWGYVARRRLRDSIVRGEGMQLGLFDWREGRLVRSTVKVTQRRPARSRSLGAGRVEMKPAP